MASFRQPRVIDFRSVVGDYWTVLILESMFSDSLRFDSLAFELDIAPNLLAHRLSRMIAVGLIDRSICAANGRSIEYRLTDVGRRTWPIVQAIRILASVSTKRTPAQFAHSS